MPIDVADPIFSEEEGAYFTFQPRPNRPEMFDEQQAFIEAMDRGVSFHIGGNGAGTTTAAMCKLARFILHRQAPPRRDTPFWVVGGDYDQTIESCWKEKLHGMGFIPDCEVDWERVTWHDLRRELPKTIPLLPWVNGDPRHNWVIEFRSYAQGRAAHQARSIGGFCLTEQFPWSILTEILRGMRMYNFPGSKFCEFTPIDPSLSRPLQEMMEDDKLPPGWRVYRANTLCNVLDPNSPVDQAWFDEFFSMVGEDMVETRQTGAWATFEGLIYKAFNTKVHVVSDLEIPRNCIHKRGIDWGSGPHNAFVVLWAAKDSLGIWRIYDEYYTTASNTWEERIRDVHRKDGWDLVVANAGPPATYKLEPIEGERQRWQYGRSSFQQTYGPPDQPGLFRELGKYCMPVTRATLGPNSYLPSIECVQAHFKYTPEEFKARTAPKIFIDRDRCPNLIRELQMLRWPQQSNRGVNPRAPGMIQVKVDDHSPDALRGMIWSDHKETTGTISSHRVETRDRPQVRHRRGR